jgi:hypothetical protein
VNNWRRTVMSPRAALVIALVCVALGLVLWLAQPLAAQVVLGLVQRRAA